MEIQPQKGKQSQFLQSSADIVVYGGSAGGGKTYGLLLEAVRNINIPNFGAVIFRQSLTQIVKEGGLYDTAETIYPLIGARGVKGNSLTFHWDRYGTKINFSYLARDVDVYGWQGTQIPLICFDELTQFSRKMFFYMLSRNRSVCGVRPYIRATTNPDPDSWVRELVDWWIDDEGFAIEERSGVIRYFVHQNDELHWFDTEDAAKSVFPTIPAKSFTFISSNVYDNKILIDQNPDYIGNLEALGRVERSQLLHGNWDVRPGAGDYFQRSNFEIFDVAPKMKHIVRCWDLAGTKPSEVNPDPDWTVGTKAGVDFDGVFWVLDVVRHRSNPTEVKRILSATTSQDGRNVRVRIPQDAGSAGKVVAQDYIKALAGYNVIAKPVTGSKEIRAKPASSQAGINNIKLLRGAWNEPFLRELESFPDAAHDDQVDTLSDAIEELTNVRAPMKVVRKPKIIR